MSFFRKDAVLQNAVGEALAGAQLYICTQPAVTGSIPPSPLATIYSDSSGSALANPVIADGYGNFFYYAQPGLYTEVYVHDGRIVKILVDQLLGGGSGSSSVAPDSVQLLNSSQSVGFAGATNTLILATGGAGGITLTLPTAIGVSGQKITVFKVDSGVGAITMNTTSAQLINAGSSYGLTNQWQVVVLESNNANWVALGN